MSDNSWSALDRNHLFAAETSFSLVRGKVLFFQKPALLGNAMLLSYVICLLSTVEHWVGIERFLVDDRRAAVIVGCIGVDVC